MATKPLQLGRAWVDPVHRELVVSGYVNQVEGPIELLAVAPGGKVHESVFVLLASPMDIHTGLLLLGFRPGAEPMPGLGQGPPTGDRISVRFAWQDAGGMWQERDAAATLRDVTTRAPAEHGEWVFNGSVTEEGRFMALAEDSVVATFWDPWALINLTAPLGADDERLVVHTESLPPLHTPVRMIFRAERP
jgi:hypothetical protein